MGCNIYTRNIYGRKGDARLPINLRFKDANGDLMDISNYNFAIQIKTKDGTVVASAATSPPSGHIITLVRVGGDNSTISWRFGTSLNLDARVYTYAIKMIDNLSQPSTIIQGDFIVEQELVTIPQD